MSLFGRALELAPRFQSYRIVNVAYSIKPRYNLSQLPGDLPLFLKVKLTSDDVPPSTVAAYSDFANVQIDILRHNVNGTGTGVAKQA